MYPVSPTFLRTLATSHTMVARVDAYFGGQLVRSNLPFDSGSVTVDRGSKSRRKLSLTIPDPSLLPWGETDVLAPYGQQLVVSRGIRYTNGAEEWVPLGTFRVDNPSGDVHLGPITVSGTSMESAIIDDKFQVPTTTRGLGGCVDAMTTLIRQTLPNAVVTNMTTGNRNPSVAVATWDAGNDRWDAITQIARAMSAEIYVDALDRFVVTDLPDVVNGPVAWDITEGEGGTLISSARSVSRTGVYNAVVASGENSASGSAPVSGTARDTDPGSPTRWGGPFGKVTKFISSALWITAGDCLSAANFALFDATAPNVETSLDSLPNPALEGNDIVRIAHAGRKERYLVQSLTVPLTADADFAVTLRGGKEDEAP
ncbi:hypothetical protein SAM23877_6116 [Streptomyces ambofaciens ATCC 23877]|uniref:DUF5047 domain-containing protein n=1 Tax=Streptomyces ambofaciens (strain ATCC 23877 / 3486 / DSM 40053 / JCM 4204 / NBRC 12836 / NRRL B-2516) TaxID=278992 RepID=A0A0K2B1Z3_STRA7|nr:DUF5047 domain-containing protein [Streptomyces ambofaciens]AKZ59161.1 hypothetical protein SAM23877_6116 [Streptomyces ambofaciens ATCC 23877]WNA15354.1 baseplate hub protein [Streptomyces phage Samy]